MFVAPHLTYDTARGKINSSYLVLHTYERAKMFADIRLYIIFKPQVLLYNCTSYFYQCTVFQVLGQQQQHNCQEAKVRKVVE
jgi:hypothetical protein